MVRAVSRTLCVCGCETEGRRCIHIRVCVCVYSRCVYVKQELRSQKEKKKRSGRKVACVGGNSLARMTPRRHAASSSTSTTSPFHPHIRFPLAVFRFSTFLKAGDRERGELTSSVEKSFRNDRFRKNNKESVRPFSLFFIFTSDFFGFLFPRVGGGRRKRKQIFDDKRYYKSPDKKIGRERD